MPIKFNKEASTHLFKFVTSVDIHFNRKSIVVLFRTVYPLPLTSNVAMSSISHNRAVSLQNVAFDARTTSIRELLRLVQTPRYGKANPRLKINTNIHNTYSAPMAQFNFIDGSEVCWTTCMDRQIPNRGCFAHAHHRFPSPCVVNIHSLDQIWYSQLSRARYDVSNTFKSNATGCGIWNGWQEYWWNDIG